MSGSKTDTALLDAYASGEMDDAEAEQLEQALFGASSVEATHSMAFYLALREQIVALAARGTIHPVVLPDDAERMRTSAAVRVGIVDLAQPLDPGSLVGAEVLLVRVPLELEGVQRLDVETTIPGVDEAVVYPDVAFDAQAGCIWMCCEIELAQASVAAGAVQRFVMVRGSERTVLREIRLGDV
ncbi:MAG: hypothetical protein HOW73_36920 [Polyangiaceae bacterium]|nr:hypothetical protein [Polyangiaceae bacterium]